MEIGRREPRPAASSNGAVQVLVKFIHLVFNNFLVLNILYMHCEQVQFDKRSQKDAVAALNGYWTGNNTGSTVLPPSQPTLIICPAVSPSSPSGVSNRVRKTSFRGFLLDGWPAPVQGHERKIDV